jgi:SET domain-containing protein
MTEGWQDNLYVGSSSIHGMGVFARRAFSTGETVLIREERPITPEEPLDVEAGEMEYHCDWLEARRQVYLGFPERFVNHSCDANAFVRFDGGNGQLVALRPINPGEEITDNYSLNLSAGKAWACTCGSLRCLGEVPGDFFDLPLALRIELQPLLADWFVREHRDAYRAFLCEAGLDQVVG